MNPKETAVIASAVIAVPVTFVVMLAFFCLYATMMFACMMAHIHLPQPALWIAFPLTVISYAIAYRLMRWIIG